MESTVEMTRFVFLQARFELAENSEKRLKRCVAYQLRLLMSRSSRGSSGMTSSAFVRVLQILHLSQGYSSIADVRLSVTII